MLNSSVPMPNEPAVLAPSGQSGADRPTKPRLRELDGVRGLAILMVLIWHFIPCQVQGDHPVRLVRILSRSLGITYTGVDLFFVLSGFLITGVCLENRGSTNFFRTFYLRRTLRILPVYLLVVATFFLVRPFVNQSHPAAAWLFHDPLPWWSYFAFLQNIVMGIVKDFGPHGLAVTWSLAVEEQFYLAFPVFVYLVSRRTILATSILLVGMAVLLRVYWPGFHAFVDTPWRMDSLLVGAIVALAVRSEKLSEILRGQVWVLYVTFCVGFFGCVALTNFRDCFGKLNHTWLAAFYGNLILIVLFHTEGMLARLMRSSVLVWLGTVSYGLYMYHQPICGAFHWLFSDREPSLLTGLGALATASALVASLAFSAVSYYLMERNLIRLGQRQKYRT